MNTYVMDPHPLDICNSFSAEIDFERHNLTCKVDPRAERVNDIPGVLLDLFLGSAIGLKYQTKYLLIWVIPVLKVLTIY